MFRDEKKLVETPMIPISLGELFDKITILEIKLEQITNKRALKNVNREYNLLLAIYKKDFSGNNGANQLIIKLKLINQKLWKIEDKIRDKEKNKLFDSEFIELARSVYIINDERSRIKREINNTLKSDLVEEKSYSNYYD